MGGSNHESIIHYAILRVLHRIRGKSGRVSQLEDGLPGRFINLRQQPKRRARQRERHQQDISDDEPERENLSRRQAIQQEQFRENERRAPDSHHQEGH